MDELSQIVGPLAWLVCVATGFLAGVIGALFGVGGGMVTTPFLNLIGLPMPLAVGTSTPVIAGSAAMATLRNRKFRNINLKAGLWLAAFMLPAVEISTRVMHTLHAHGSARFDTIVRICFIIAVLITTTTWLFRRDTPPADGGFWGRIRIPPFVTLLPPQRLSVWVIAASGALAGFFAGFLGLGGGRIIVPVLLGVVGMALKPSVGTSSLVILLSSLLAAISYSYLGMVDFRAAAALLAGSVTGAWFGSAAMHRIETKLMRGLYLLLSGAALASLLLKQAGASLSGLGCLLGTVTVIALIAIGRSWWLRRRERAAVLVRETYYALG